MAVAMPLDTARLTLRPMVETDAAFILELLNEPAFLQYIGDKGVRTLDDARRYIAQGPVASYAEHGFGLEAVCLRTDGTPIGICGLLKRDTLPDPDIGFAYLEAYRGAGYGYEAAQACVSRARDTLRLPRLLAITSPDNMASIALLEKLGFRLDRIAPLAAGQRPVKIFMRAL